MADRAKHARRIIMYVSPVFAHPRVHFLCVDALRVVKLKILQSLHWKIGPVPEVGLPRHLLLGEESEGVVYRSDAACGSWCAAVLTALGRVDEPAQYIEIELLALGGLACGLHVRRRPGRSDPPRELQEVDRGAEAHVAPCGLARERPDGAHKVTLDGHNVQGSLNRSSILHVLADSLWTCQCHGESKLQASADLILRDALAHSAHKHVETRTEHRVRVWAWFPQSGSSHDLHVVL
mmetsp:Transcript_48819/g.128740  ORF Transcript_48819/g.128740 Transcript_48819/m.128740 type:complete len:236 (+) Transcript_48819:671-1378(+)